MGVAGTGNHRVSPTPVALLTLSIFVEEAEERASVVRSGQRARPRKVVLCSQVLPGLYIGNFRDSKDPEQLEENGITHILSIHDNAKKLHPDKEYLCIVASDTPGQNLTQFFSTCNDFIHEGRLAGGNVLVHCLAGVSRSVTVVVAYIMSTTALGWRDALNAVRGARQIANPNFGFQRQLYDFELEKLGEERRRMRDRFPVSPYPDEDECRKLVLEHQNARRLAAAAASCEGPASRRSAQLAPYRAQATRSLKDRTRSPSPAALVTASP